MTASMVARVTGFVTCCDKVPDVEFKERGKFVARSKEDAVVMVEKAWQQGHELLDTLRL